MIQINVIPAVRVPADAKIATPVEIKLKRDWHFDSTLRAFVSDRGEKFIPRNELPKRTRIVHKTPSLAAAARTGKAKLSGDERNLLRHLHVILPADQSAAKYLEKIRRWPSIAEANLPPAISLPKLSA